MILCSPNLKYSAPEVFAEIEKVIELLLSITSIFRPPVNTMQVALSLGCNVVSTGFLQSVLDRRGWSKIWPDGMREQRALGMLDLTTEGHLIAVHEGMDFETTQFVIGHEIGEALMDKVAEAVGGLNSDEREHLSDCFSVFLLTPRHWFSDDCRRFGWNLARLRARYSTAPVFSIALRWLTVADSPTIVTVMEGDKLLFRDGNGPACMAIHPLERRAKATAWRTGQPVRLRGDGLTVDAWPVSECGIRRVILRTECMD